ncbi:hypothetical protein HDE_08404 [Halotydeus destructor]|nr:hypothetical protein HDE_08404 [Halotydeus destructor]
MDMKQMPTTYIKSSIILYVIFLMVVSLFCTVPRATQRYTINAVNALFMVLLTVLFLLFNGGLSLLAIIGAVRHHLMFLTIYVCICFVESVLTSIGCLIYSLPGEAFFIFVFINSFSTMIPAYLAYCIHNADKSTAIPALNTQRQPVC